MSATNLNNSSADSTSTRRLRRGGAPLLVAVFIGAAVLTALVAWVLVTIVGHKVAERTPFVRVVEVNEVTTDPVPWGRNWPHQFDGWKSTAGDAYYGGSSAMPESKLEQDPWLKRLYSGYAFSLDYREARGHAYMLYDQTVTERVTERSQSGACLHCHASVNVLYRRVGLESMGEQVEEEALAERFNMPAVIAGFRELSRQPYHEVLGKLLATPDGTPGESEPAVPQPPIGAEHVEHPEHGEAHPVSCIDCHDPQSMGVRVTRPGFVLGIRELAESDAPVPHLPSIEEWRASGRTRPYDPNVHASRQEMRSFTCAQCHVEYYCADKMTLTFPWGNGLTADDAERYWEDLTFPDGTGFYDWKHGETGAELFKVQHPEFELWSQGIHARSGVSCADCHMPYERRGAMKISSHHVRSPMENINNACQTCHNVSEEELRQRVHSIQERTVALKERAAEAMTDMLDAILEAKASGATDEQLAGVLELQRKSMWRLDYISSENSKGFHADQEAARILGESIDYSRRAQAMALRLRAPDAPSTEGIEKQPVLGTTPAEKAPND